MPHIVTSPCVDHKYQECVAVCPVEAFREADTYLVIDPDECIDCGVCEPECPPEAILPDTEQVAEAWIAFNTEKSEAWPNITRRKDAPADADDFRDTKGKFESFFIDRPGTGDA